MMLSASSLLAKVNRLKRETIANQPVDPLACLSDGQRGYFEKWVKDFHSGNSENADGFYAALIEHKHWTPFEWLKTPMIMDAMSEDKASQVYSDFRDGVK
ncbi:hypothetical protein [Primorskyibacter sp. 2E233]|uniref:hypothetical protein n=1 Tax=Primorskyibacter sp. 2E233 TaxID=3413431 RepID=UPI003BF0D6D9